MSLSLGGSRVFHEIDTYFAESVFGATITAPWSCFVRLEQAQRRKVEYTNQ